MDIPYPQDQEVAGMKRQSLNPRPPDKMGYTTCQMGLQNLSGTNCDSCLGEFASHEWFYRSTLGKGFYCVRCIGKM